MQTIGGEDMVADQLRQRLKRGSAGTDPVGHGRDFDGCAFMRERIGLTMQR